MRGINPSDFSCGTFRDLQKWQANTQRESQLETCMLYIWKQVFRHIHIAFSTTLFTHSELYNYTNTSASSSEQTRRYAGVTIYTAMLEIKQTHAHSWTFAVIVSYCKIRYHPSLDFFNAHSPDLHQRSWLPVTEYKDPNAHSWRCCARCGEHWE